MRAAVAIRRAISAWCAPQQARRPGGARIGHAGFRDAAQPRARPLSRAVAAAARRSGAGTAPGAGRPARARRAPGAVNARGRGHAPASGAPGAGTGVHQSPRLRADAAVHGLRLDRALPRVRCAADGASGQQPVALPSLRRSRAAARALPALRVCGQARRPGHRARRGDAARAVSGRSRCCAWIAIPPRDRRSSTPSCGRSCAGEARILVGTQMVTKGHHFPGISLVVVLNADQGLFSTDFRAAERLAQTIVQVAGRAGRERRRGEVLIQTEYPEHPLLQSLLAGGYEGFAATALRERAAARWPPFGRLALLRASTRSPAAARSTSCARPGSRGAGQRRGVRVLGPVAAAMARRAGRYYAQLLIEQPERGPLHRFSTTGCRRSSRPGAARSACAIALDVDPHRDRSDDPLRLDSPPPITARTVGLKSELERLLADASEYPGRFTLLPHADRSGLDQRRARARCQPRRLCQQHRAAAGASAAGRRRASSPRRSSRRCRRARCWRAPKWRAPGSSISISLHECPQRGAARRCSSRASATARATPGAASAILLEFVSANPTGPLHVGHGRQAAYGATLGNLLRATGYEVHREYYINDAGRQMDILTRQHLAALPGALRRNVAVPRQRLSRRLRARHRRAARATPRPRAAATRRRRC